MRTDPKPADAWWDPKEKEWVHGEKDAGGRLIGEVRYWNAEDVLISTADHVAGKPHGIARRYYPNGEVSQDSTYVDGLIDGIRHFLRPADPAVTADGHLARCAGTIATYQCIYEHGDLIGMLFFDRDGRELDEHGRPMRERPSNIPPTSFYLQKRWHWTRRRGEAGTDRIAAREYYEDGTLALENDYVTGTERAFHANGKRKHEGQRNTGANHYQNGTWRYYDDAGELYLVAEHDSVHAHQHLRRTWHRGGETREGPVDQGLEVGTWIVRDATGASIAELDLGQPMTEADLLAHAVCAELLDDSYRPVPTDRSLSAVLARARRAGITGNRDELGLDPGPAWHDHDDTGKPTRLAVKSSWTTGTIAVLHALRWGPPDGALLAELAALLFRNSRAPAALDVIDAALLLGADPAWRAARGSYLRALGRAAEAEAVLAGPDRLEPRAIALLEEIRANPDDDAPRLVLADLFTAQFPEHAALIVAQCTGHRDEAELAAFVATVPDFVTEHGPPVRGFFEQLLYFEAEQFVACDLDLLFRIGPSCTRVELTYASHHIATLVTLPGLRRYRELSFSDTYLQPLQIEQLGACPYLDDLEHLGLYGTGLGDDDLRALANATAFPRLQSLNISYGREDMDYTLVGFRLLAGAPFASTLRVLTASGRRMGDDAIDVIARFPALVDLDLTRGGLTDAGALALAGLHDTFTSLALGGNDFTDRGRHALVEKFGERVNFDGY